MIFLGIIESTIGDDSRVKIRIPRLHKPKNELGATPTQDLPLAYICTAPGISPVYKEGDVVCVGFEANNINNPIIIGALYNKQTFPKIETQANLTNLSVQNKAELSDNIFINATQLMSADMLNKKLSTINEQLDTLDDKIDIKFGANNWYNPSLMNATKQELLESFNKYLLYQVDVRSLYVWGAQGQYYKDYLVANSNIVNVTSWNYNDWDDSKFVSWVTKREKNDTKQINRVLKQAQSRWDGQTDINKIQCFDCSGLGVYWLYNVMGIIEYDMNADTLYKQCNPIAKASVSNGCWVFRTTGGRKTHIGYVVDDNGTLVVVEAKGRDVGVVKSNWNAQDSYWDSAGVPKYFYGN